MGVYRKLAILTRGTLRYARGTGYAGKYASVRYVVRSSTLQVRYPTLNFF